jgi:nucleotide-binding universal stress UspA family protein
MPIRTVLCPVDFSALDERELAVALEVCRTFEARLVLHHDVPTAEPGFARVWEWAKARPEEPGDASAETSLRALLDRVANGVPAETVVTSGPLVESVLGLAERLPADLVVLGSHGWSTRDHASVASRVISGARCPVLTFQERDGAQPFRLRARAGGPPPRALVPTDFTPASAVAVDYACALARRLGIALELLHVLPEDAGPGAFDRAQRALAGLVPPDLIGNAVTHVRRGEPAAELTRYVAATGPSFVVLGEHARGVVRHLLTPDTTEALMRRIDCPAWVVPASALTAKPRADADARADRVA